MARPSQLNDAVQERIVQRIEAGSNAATAAASVGISERAFYLWLRRGRKEARGQYRRFHDAVQVARARGEVRMVALLSLAAEKDWRAAAFLLERRNPSQWGRRDKQTVTLKGDVKHPVSTSAITAERASEELVRRLAETRSRLVAAGGGTIWLVGDDANID